MSTRQSELSRLDLSLQESVCVMGSWFVGDLENAVRTVNRKGRKCW